MAQETKVKNKTEREVAFGLFTFSRNVADKSLTLIISAFGLVAALAWNEAIKKTLTTIFKSGGTTISLFIYAIIMTLLAVVITMRLAKIQDRLEKEEKDKESKK